MKPGGLATGAFRATGLPRAAFAYGPSTYWPLGAAFSLSLPRRTRAFGAGRLAACGLAAPACLAPPALGFTLAAVVGILILEKMPRCRFIGRRASVAALASLSDHW